MNKVLHIISFNVPYPANYGGVIDVFYKIQALHAAGIKIHLHCFEYGLGQQPALNQFCESVNYYPRLKGHNAISSKLPYIVASRRNETLIENLLKDDFPILMEGIHCTYPVLDERFKNRELLVRLHNVEYQYYRDLFRSSKSLIRKLYYWNESRLLKAYESELAKKVKFLGISEKDIEVYQQEFGCSRIEYHPLFLPDWDQSSSVGMGNYCLYHGDLSVDANEKAVTWLLEEVFRELKLPLVIAGKDPSEKLIEIAHEQKHTCIVENPSHKEMQDMIAKAHINLIPSYTHSGMKVKLMNALYNGKYCIANKATLAGTNLEAFCTVANTKQEFQDSILKLFNQPFSEKEVENRKNLLSSSFNKQQQAALLIKSIWKS